MHQLLLLVLLSVMVLLLIMFHYGSKSDMPAAQFGMKWAEASGWGKFDFLGLKTLTIIQNTINLLAQRNILLI